MTITTQTTRTVYSGNGSTTAFPTLFQFFDESDLVVTDVLVSDGTETVKTITTHYTVSGGAGSTGTVTMLAAPATGHRLVIQRVSELVQDTDLVVQGEIPADSVETRFDKLTLFAQEAALDAVRAIRTNKAQTGTINTEVPLLDDRAGYVFVVNDDEDGFDLADIADISSAIDAVLVSPAADDFMVYTSGAWRNRTPAQSRTHLSVYSIAEADALLAVKQPLDSDLTAIAALSTAAYGRSLLTLASAAALGTELAAIYQPLDSDLTAIAALTSAANKVPYATGAGAWALADFPAAARTFFTTPSSANLAALLSDETGSGTALFGDQAVSTGSTVQHAAIELSHATANTLTGSGGVLSIEGHAIPTKDQAATISALYTFSAGIAFANETLSTYDEGTWTPGFASGGSSTGVTYSVQEGYYTKIGNVVTVSGQVTLTNNGTGTGNCTITGLPFTSKTITNGPLGLCVFRWGPGITLTANYTFVGLSVGSAGTTATFIQSGSGQTAAGMDDTVMSNTSAVYFAGAYPASTS